MPERTRAWYPTKDPRPTATPGGRDRLLSSAAVCCSPSSAPILARRHLRIPIPVLGAGDQLDVVDPGDDVLEVVVGGVFPADQVAVRRDLAGLAIAIGIDHRLVRLPGEPRVAAGDHSG